MGFFDNIAATVTKGAREAADNAKLFADKTRIKKDINNCENELRNRYCDIGKLFFENNKDNVPEEYAALFEGIGPLLDEIAAKQKELDALDGTVSCPGCGKPIAKDAKFCPNCGQTVPQPEIPPVGAATVCPTCGAALAAGAAFCASCGNRVGGAETVNATVVANNVCPNCGATLAADAVFCAECGTKAPGLN